MTRRVLVAALLACLAGVPLAAHHSWAGFEPTPTVFTARVQSLTIANPHTLIDLQAADGQRYRIVFMASSALRRAFRDGAAEMARQIRVNEDVLISGRLKRGEDVIEVLALEIDDAFGKPVYPADRPPITRPRP